MVFFVALSVLRGSKEVFFAALRGQKEVAVAVAVLLRGPPWPSVDKGVAVAVLRGPPCPSWINRGVLRGPSWPFVDKKKLPLPLPFSAALRGPPRTKKLPLQFSAALRVLRGQRCCRSSWPSVALRGQKEAAVAVAVLRGPPCPPWTKVLPLQFFVALRGPSWTKRSCRCRCSSPRPSVSSVDKGVAVAVLRGPPWPFVDKKKLPLPLQFSAALRVLRGQRCCRCRSSWPSVALRGQKEAAVAVAVLRGPPCLRGKGGVAVLRALRRPSWTKVQSRCKVLRGPPWPFVDKKKLPLPLQFSAALRVLRGQRCCRCRSSCPSWFKKGVFFAALQGRMA